MIAFDPLLSVSTGITSQLRRFGLLPRTGITTEFGGNASNIQNRPVVNR
jgi:hypothetical protein